MAKAQTTRITAKSSTTSSTLLSLKMPLCIWQSLSIAYVNGYPFKDLEANSQDLEAHVATSSHNFLSHELIDRTRARDVVRQYIIHPGHRQLTFVLEPISQLTEPARLLTDALSNPIIESIFSTPGSPSSQLVSIPSANGPVVVRATIVLCAAPNHCEKLAKQLKDGASMATISAQGLIPLCHAMSGSMGLRRLPTDAIDHLFAETLQSLNLPSIPTDLHYFGDFTFPGPTPPSYTVDILRPFAREAIQEALTNGRALIRGDDFNIFVHSPTIYENVLRTASKEDTKSEWEKRCHDMVSSSGSEKKDIDIHAAIVESIKRVRDITSSMPLIYEERQKLVASLSDGIRSTIAAAIEPTLNAYLATLPHATYEDKQRMATWVNGQLRGLALAIRCPKTGKPAILIADVRAEAETGGRFRLEVRGDQGRRVRTSSSNRLPELQLMADIPRLEPFAKWDGKPFNRTELPGR